ncbi:heat-inducible transcriptional repressor HrcA [Anaerococcus tetradius]|uniref:heat-inducible transcriptional repressor HrcA n=1 Tax=Anaerococcus tetradius TaxID=33036 RepID=UPI0023F1BFFA|nr:heat-inducible transcriptional repressor HrcA [Anaerococcus tetradius]
MKDRRTQILFSIIDSYIYNGEPVGSKSLADDYSFDVSPATIRNDMSSLEKNGFLKKAHTSSGRLPSDKGYRLFVDYLLENGLIEEAKFNNFTNIRQLLDKRYHNARDIIETATKTLAAMTNLTAVSVSFKKEISKIVNVELMRVSENFLLLIAVFDNGSLVNEQILLDYPISDEDLLNLNNILNHELIGHKLTEIDKILADLEKSMLTNYKKLVDIIGQRINNNSKDELNRDVRIEGIGNIFNFKEFDDLNKARDFIKLFDSKDVIKDLWSDIEDKNLVITIGEENPIDLLKESTIITSYFNVDENTVGKIGIVGLTRINYKEVIASIRMISDLLNE